MVCLFVGYTIVVTGQTSEQDRKWKKEEKAWNYINNRRKMKSFPVLKFKLFP